MGSTVLIVSQRERPDGFGRQPGYVSFIEAEDVIAGCSDADMVLVERSPTDLRVRARRIAGRAVRRLPELPAGRPDRSSRSGAKAIGGRRLLPIGRGGATGAVLQPHYDVAVFIAFTLWDLPLLERMRDVRRRADRVIVWLPEAWSSEFDDHRLALEPFALADTILVGMKAAVDRLAELTPRPVHHVAPAVDALRFAAMTDDPRPIDLLGIGRRDDRLHRALLDWARKSNKLYIYDTISGPRVSDVDAHRENLADTYRRSKIAMTNYAKFDEPAVTRGERETPGRLWEGLAGGSVLIGVPPDERLQREIIGETVVMAVPDDASTAVELIDETCRADNDTLRRHHGQMALRGHDWIHRWRDIFELSDLALPSGFAPRLDRLEAMATAVDPGHT